MAVGACGVVGPAYRVTTGLGPLAVTGSELGEGTSVRPGQQFGWSIGGGWPRALCWVPETARSPISSGLVGGVWLGDRCPPPEHHRK